MKKKILHRMAIGFPLGVALSYGITIIISLFLADGYYAPCVPELTDAVGSELGAVILQALLSGLMGAGFGAASLIWEYDTWSLTRQTGLYFVIISLILLPVAYICHWMAHNLWGILSYFAIFAVIFIFIWLVSYLIIKKNIRQMNKCLHKKK